MDALTHLFLPITVAYAVRPDLFTDKRTLALAVFAVLPDADKVFHMSGAFHSILTLGMFGGGLLVVEQRLRGRRTYASLAVLLMFSHLLLDLIDGGPVTLLYPLVDLGVGLTYESTVSFGDAIHQVTLSDLVPSIRTGNPNVDRRSYPFLKGYGVLSALVFLTVYVGSELRNRERPR